jgi:hypothetical protein
MENGVGEILSGTGFNITKHWCNDLLFTEGIEEHPPLAVTW